MHGSDTSKQDPKRFSELDSLRQLIDLRLSNIEKRLDEKFAELKEDLADVRNGFKEDLGDYRREHAEEHHRDYLTHVEGPESVHTNIEKRWNQQWTQHNSEHAATTTRFYVTITVLGTLLGGAFVLIHTDPPYLFSGIIAAATLIYALVMSGISLRYAIRWRNIKMGELNYE
jgi:hypothetical protein